MYNVYMKFDTVSEMLGEWLGTGLALAYVVFGITMSFLAVDAILWEIVTSFKG